MGPHCNHGKLYACILKWTTTLKFTTTTCHVGQRGQQAWIINQPRNQFWVLNTSRLLVLLLNWGGFPWISVDSLRWFIPQSHKISLTSTQGSECSSHRPTWWLPCTSASGSWGNGKFTFQKPKSLAHVLISGRDLGSPRDFSSTMLVFLLVFYSWGWCSGETWKHVFIRVVFNNFYPYGGFHQWGYPIYR